MLGLKIASYIQTWSPKNLEGLLMWFKHNDGLEDAGGDFPVDGENIAVWRDQSGNSNDASGLTNPPTYKLSETSPDFDVAAAGFSIPQQNLGKFAIYWRCKLYGDIAADVFVNDAQSTADDFLRINNTTQIRAQINNGSNINFTTNTTLNQTTYYNFGLERDASGNFSSYEDNVSLTQTLGGSQDPTANPFDMDQFLGGTGVYVKEAVICTEVLSPADRELLNTYLRYG